MRQPPPNPWQIISVTVVAPSQTNNYQGETSMRTDHMQFKPPTNGIHGDPPVEGGQHSRCYTCATVDLLVALTDIGYCRIRDGSNGATLTHTYPTFLVDDKTI